MVGISMNELTTYRWSFEEDVQQYVRAGYDAIAIWRQKLSDFGDEKGAELLADSGLQVSSLLWAGGFTGSDGRSFKESLEDAHEAIRVASLVQAPCLIVHSGSRAGHTQNHARRLLVNALNELLPAAQQAGVTLALEPMHEHCAHEWTFLTSVEETLTLVSQIGHSQLKIAFDTYYQGLSSGLVESLMQWSPHLAVIQLGDTRRDPDLEQDRCPLGEGIVPLEQIVSSLMAAGYEGYWEVKLMGQEIETTDYQDLLRESRQVVSRLLNARV